VVGAGAWGTALGHVAKAAGNDVAFWSRQNPDAKAVADAGALVLAVPAQAVRGTLRQLSCAGKIIIIAAKGIERGTHMLMADVVRDCVPSAVPMVLSGPSFAADVMKALPTAVTLAADDMELAQVWSETLSIPHFRIYQSNDVRGVELGGALKNVLAIACGISDGLALGESARAALITRGFAELFRLATAMGAQSQTLMGLSGLGDLLLTAGSPQSRNYKYGLALGRGQTPDQALAQSSGVVEGAYTTIAAFELAQQHDIDMPIVNAVHDIIDRGQNPAEIVKHLLLRKAGREF
jgi:glycerol-3-phosphate dehydrogenase (NAD(P)+)